MPRKDAIEYMAKIFYDNLLTDLTLVGRPKRDYVQKMIEWGLTNGERIYSSDTDCSKTNDPECLYLSRVEAATLAIRAYERTPLEKEGFNIIDKPEMLERYKKNIELYEKDSKFHDDSAFAYLLKSYDMFTANYTLESLSDDFDLFQMPLASFFIKWFLKGTGTNITFNIDEVLDQDTKAKQLVLNNIKNKLAAGDFSGKVRIEQSDWGIQNFHFAFGGLDIVWQVNRAKTSIIFYVNNQYSFNIIEARPSNSIYIEAARKVLDGKASDYYMVSLVKKPISWITSGVASAKKIPIISDVLPDKVILDEDTTFTVIGQNLSSTLALSVDGCKDVIELGGIPALAEVAATSIDFIDSSSGTFTTRLFSCTPSSDFGVGIKAGAIKDAQNNILHNFEVNFLRDTVVTSVSISTAILNEPATFTVTGQNFPSTLAF